MIRNCIRKGCRNTFACLNQGQVYSLERRPAGTTEFLWLCADCQLKYAIAVSSEGEVDVVPREQDMRPLLPNPQVDLRLFSARFTKSIAA